MGFKLQEVAPEDYGLWCYLEIRLNAATLLFVLWFNQ